MIYPLFHIVSFIYYRMLRLWFLILCLFSNIRIISWLNRTQTYNSLGLLAPGHFHIGSYSRLKLCDWRLPLGQRACPWSCVCRPFDCVPVARTTKPKHLHQSSLCEPVVSPAATPHVCSFLWCISCWMLQSAKTDPKYQPQVLVIIWFQGWDNVSVWLIINY